MRWNLESAIGIVHPDWIALDVLICTPCAKRFQRIARDPTTEPWCVKARSVIGKACGTVSLSADVSKALLSGPDCSVYRLIGGGAIGVIFLVGDDTTLIVGFHTAASQVVDVLKPRHEHR